MKKIVILSGDTKLLKEAGQWLKELNEEVVIDTVSNLVVFNERYCQALPAAEPDGTEPKQNPMVRMVVADLELVTEDPIVWIKKTRTAMIEQGNADIQFPTRFMLIGYSEGGFNVDKFRDPVIDDLMLKPLDKSVFLQKGELYLSDKNDVRPSFLFKQKTEQIIEMGKDTFIESVSEFGFAIRNPAPLTSGVFAKVYSEIFGVGDKAAVIGRVYSAERHPSEQGAYVCYLTFFGILAEQLASIRKLIRQDKTAASKRERPPMQMDAPVKTVVIIDINADTREIIRDSLESNFANISVVGFPSYNAFVKYLLNRTPGNGLAVPTAEPQEPSPAAEKTLANDKRITFMVDMANGELMSMDPSPRDSVLVLGEEAGDLRTRPAMWMKVFDAANKETIEEFLVYLRSGQSGSILVSADARHIGRVNLRITGRIERAADADGISVAALKLEELSDDDWQDQHASSTTDCDVDGIDAIYLDGSFLGENPESTLEGLFQTMRRANVIQSREALSLTIFGDERSKLKPADFRLRMVHDFLYKPIDRKMLIAKAAVNIRGLMQKTDAVDLHYRRANRKGRVTKEVLMGELSEFGLQITHPTPLREDTFLRFFSPIFLDTTGNGLLGRCLFSERDETDGQYRCFFNFFGATDSQLKHIRNWIRGDYAARKEKKSGG